MRRHRFTALILLAFGCGAAMPEAKPALTREQATLFRAMLNQATPAAVQTAPAGRARRRLKKELDRLSRTLELATPAQLLAQIARVRQAAPRLTQPVALVLQEAEAAAQSQTERQ